MSSEMWWGPWAGGRKMTSFRGCRVLNARGTGMLSCKKNLMVQGNDTKLLLFFVCVILNILRMLEVFGLCFVLGVVDVTVWNTGIMQYDHRQSQPKLTDLPDREVSESSRKRNYFSLFFFHLPHPWWFYKEPVCTFLGWDMQSRCQIWANQWRSPRSLHTLLMLPGIWCLRMVGHSAAAEQGDHQDQQHLCWNLYTASQT